MTSLDNHHKVINVIIYFLQMTSLCQCAFVNLLFSFTHVRCCAGMIFTFHFYSAFLVLESC